MATTIICPDCGGVISGDAQEGVQHCHCAARPTNQPGFPPAPVRPKICCQCGKDLVGHTRYHDSRGYWCQQCRREDQKASAPQGQPCASCGRVVDPLKLVAYEGVRICRRCMNERTEARRKPKAISFSRHHLEHEKKLVLVLALIVLILLLIATLASRGHSSSPWPW